MRRGCISLGEINCDKCHRPIPHGERYLAVEEERGKEAESGKTTRYCMDCALKKGYASYRQEKDEKILTIFPPA
jgi:RNase P subunit RPR2